MERKEEDNGLTNDDVKKDEMRCYSTSSRFMWNLTVPHKKLYESPKRRAGKCIVQIAEIKFKKEVVFAEVVEDQFLRSRRVSLYQTEVKQNILRFHSP